MATDLRNAPPGPTERPPRSRGGAHAAGPRAAGRAATVNRPAAAGRSAVAGLCAVAIVAVVVPLAALQIPDAIAWSLPAGSLSAGSLAAGSLAAGLASAGPDGAGSLLRAASLALPAMAVAVPFGALAVRRFRAGRVLAAALAALAVADALGAAARTVALIGADRALHGLGAGIALAAVAAIVAERARAARVLAGWWACVTVCALAAAPALMRHRVTGGGWHAALAPSVWLTGAALVLAVLYALLGEGAPSVAVRIAFPPAERSLLTLLAAPVAGLSAIAVTMAARGGHAVLAAALAGVIALAGLTIMATRFSSAGPLAAVCAVTGFTVVPAAGAITSLAPAAQLGPSIAWAMAAGAACGAALVLVRPGRDGVAAGLFVAAAAFGAAYPAGPALTHAGVLVLLCVPLAGGMAAALAAAWRPGTGPGGAMCGVVLLLAGTLSGGLAAGALRVLVAPGAQSAAASVTIVTDWSLIAAALAGTAALVTAFWPARRRSARPGRTAERG